jgi:hypothetical protein
VAAVHCIADGHDTAVKNSVSATLFWPAGSAPVIGSNVISVLALPCGLVTVVH